MKDQINLSNFIKYCLGYLKLINPSFSRFKLFTDPISEDILTPESIFSLADTEQKVLFDLDSFYEYNPKNVPEEKQNEYEEQKKFAIKIEEIKNKLKVDEYTKQISLNFGFFKVSVPENQDIEEDPEVEEQKKLPLKKENEYYSLFSLPVEIVYESNKFYLRVLDGNIIPNLGFLSGILKEDQFYEFSEYVNGLEMNEKLSLPLDNKVVEGMWNELKVKLKLSDAEFDEDSFELNRFVISLSAKSNYFLVQDLQKLAEESDESLQDSSLGSWISDDDLNNVETVNDEEGELFFPFDYDKYQLRVLSIVNNKAAVVEGPPGTGKSQTIANILCHLAAQNKKVLFLSQKAQALKVVKDKLKQLDTNYLYGYIPNRNSPLFDSEEDKDSAANTLLGLNQYISASVYSNKKKDEDKFLQYSAVSNCFNDSITKERDFYRNYQEFLDLADFELGFYSDNFLKEINKDDFSFLCKLEDEITGVEKKCGSFVEECKSLSSLENKFKNISKEEVYSKSIDDLISHIKEKWRDRGDKLSSFVNNPLLKFRIRSILKKLPREIFDQFSIITKKNLSKSETIEELSSLKDYFYYKENCHSIKKLNEDFDQKIQEFDLNRKTFNRLKELIEGHTNKEKIFEQIKQRMRLSKLIEDEEITDPNFVNTLLHQVRMDRQDRIKTYLRNIITNHIQANITSASTRGIIARIARAFKKSKKAYKTFDKLKSDPTNFEEMRELIPVWIMDLEDVSRIVPMEQNLFDYIIIDEASQCNIAYALPAMYRSKHVIFFGDTKQMRDDSIKFKTNKSLLDLANKFAIPDHLQIKSQSDSVKSVMDIGILRGFKVETLLRHYRSPKEIIGFSNEYFYSKKNRLEVINSNYLVYKNTNRVMVNHVINSGQERDVSDKSNIDEANYILNLIKELKSDPSTANKSIGVLTFFNQQACLLRDMIEDESIKVSIIEGIQGDERDIIIYSFVISDSGQKRKYIALTGEGGDIAKELNEGRVNVAFSRARLQVHCVTSLSPKEWPEGVWIKKYLEYVDDNGEVNFYDQSLKKFDSHFEEEFYYLLRNKLGKDFIIQNQIESCGFKIDFVITDTVTNKKLAIECDGPTHFEDENSEREIYVESDLIRQSVLESAGWSFIRVLYSKWIEDDFDKQSIVDNILDYFSTGKLKFQDKNADLSGLMIDNPYSNVIHKDEPKVVQKETPAEITEDNARVDVDSDEANVSGSQTTETDRSANELLRYEVGENEDIVASLINENQTLWLCEFLRTSFYTGPKKGIAIAVSDLQSFIDKIADTVNQGTTNYINWNGSGKSQIHIKRTPIGSIDIRQYVKSAKFTGFTKRGLTLKKDLAVPFLNELVEKINSVIE